MYSHITANVQKKAERRLLEGRWHLVAPAVMLTENVVNGSGGPIFYPAEENGKEPDTWNHMPIVVYHPKEGDDFVSARQVKFIDDRKVGLVLNTAHDDAEKKLKAECWFDEERTKEVDIRVYNALVNGTPMELSTGLGLRVEKKKGEFNGTKYKGIARDHRPDHLAILPDERGACSIEMGAGLFANTAALEDQPTGLRAGLMMLVGNEDMSPAVREEVGKSGTAMPDGTFQILNETDIKTALAVVNRAKNPTAARFHIADRAKKLGKEDLVPKDFIANDGISLGDQIGAVRQALASTFGEKGKYWEGWLEDVYPDYVIYCSNGVCYKVEYKISSAGTVEFSGDPVIVVRTTEYRPIANQATNPIPSETVVMFDKKAYVGKLIANGQIDETQRAAFEALDETVLKGIKLVEKAPTPTPTPPPAPIVNAEQKPITPMTLDQLRQVLPPEMMMVINQGQKALDQSKKRFKEVITNAPGNVFTETQLDKFDLDTLAAMAELAGGNQPQQQQSTEYLNGWQPNYGMAVGGRAGLIGNRGKDEPLEDPPEVPDIDFSK